MIPGLLDQGFGPVSQGFGPNLTMDLTRYAGESKKVPSVITCNLMYSLEVKNLLFPKINIYLIMMYKIKLLYKFYL